MARGWESKAVVDQQPDAQRAATAPTGAVDPADAARRARRATLQLARTRALADLQHACASAHRAMLEAAIRDLDEQIRAV
jgi:hypothetical protein